MVIGNAKVVTPVIMKGAAMLPFWVRTKVPYRAATKVLDTGALRFVDEAADAAKTGANDYKFF